MPAYGSIEKFSGRGEEFEVYVERLQHYFTANDLQVITPTQDNAALVAARHEKRKAILLSVIGGETYTLLRTLTAPARPADKSFAEIVNLLQNHFSPAPSEIVCRYKFHTRSRQQGETVSTFMAELRRLADTCNFGNVLNDMLRDRLVCGINDERIQRVLLAERTLTLQQAYSKSLAEELAYKDTSLLQGEQINKVDNRKRKGPRWMPGVIVDVMNRSYSVQMSGLVTKRHEDQLRPRSVSVPESKVPSGCDSAPIAKENNITPLLNNDQQSKNSSTELPATLPEEALTSGPPQSASPESPCVEKQLHWTLIAMIVLPT